jgi:hypothetical protein
MLRWRRPREADEHFVDSIKEALRVVTPVPADTPGRFDPSPGVLHVLELGADRPVPLRGQGRISLRFRLCYRLDQDADGWWAQVAAYQYTLLDYREQEIVAYHWHPEGQSQVVTPHLHLGAGALIGRTELGAAHLQTGPVPPTAAIRLAVEAFGAQPSRQQWDVTLREAEAALLES